MPMYHFKVRHDDGHIFVSCYKQTEQEAREQVCRLEGCPDHALTLTKVERTFKTHKTAKQLKRFQVQTSRTERQPGESDVHVKLWCTDNTYHVSIVKDPALNVLWGEDEGKQWKYFDTVKEARETFAAFGKLAETF